MDIHIGFQPVVIAFIPVIFKLSKGYSKDYVKSFSAVLQQSFRFAVFPKQYITFNPMQYVVMRHKKEEAKRESAKLLEKVVGMN